MAEETGRKRGRKQITLPSGQKIFIPVITKLAFIDPSDRYQETQFTTSNDFAGQRKVHVVDLAATDPLGRPSGQGTIKVERIDQWPVFDSQDRAQETQWSPDNVTGEDTHPPHFSTHSKTHVYRYYQDPNDWDDDGVWVDSELIDEWQYVDSNDRAQETQFALNNPAPDDDSGQANPDDPEVTDTGNGIDPPYRTDPWQNIINWHSGSEVFPPTITIHVQGGAGGGDILAIAQFHTVTVFAEPPAGATEHYNSLIRGGFSMSVVINIAGVSMSLPPFSPTLVPPGYPGQPPTYTSSWQPPGWDLVSTSPPYYVNNGFTQTGNISAKFSYSTLEGIETYEWTPLGGSLHRQTLGLPTDSTDVSASINTAAWSVTVPGTFWGETGDLHFHVHAMELGPSDPSNQLWYVYMYSDELGPPTPWPPTGP